MSNPVERVINRLITSFSGSHEKLRQEMVEYEAIIRPHFTYFNELTATEKLRFLKRIYWFKRKKKFHFKDVEFHPSIPVMVSACAVQITFGLRKYRMPYFRNIYILSDQYRYGANPHPWIGHVNREGIHLSWKHFMQGYSVHGDRYNVGLHEMAHALVYVNFLDNEDEKFANNFLHYKKKAEALLPKLSAYPCKLFTEQAAHNYHECWAESVELFFENPVELKQHYPELYEHIKKLLNQDPASKIKVLHPYS